MAPLSRKSCHIAKAQRSEQALGLRVGGATVVTKGSPSSCDAGILFAVSVPQSLVSTGVSPFGWATVSRPRDQAGWASSGSCWQPPRFLFLVLAVLPQKVPVQLERAQERMGCGWGPSDKQVGPPSESY